MEQKITSDNQISIGQNIKEIRMRQGMLQKELVEKLQLEGLPVSRD